MVRIKCPAFAYDRSDISIKVGSHWERSYHSKYGKAGEIIQVIEITPYGIKWGSECIQCSKSYFFSNFTPRPDLDKPQQEKEIKMTIQQLLQSLFGAEKPTTDYDRRPAILVVAYNRDGSQIGTAVANNLEDVKSKVAGTPDLWGCKVLTYVLDQEVSVDVPVKAIKAKIVETKE